MQCTNSICCESIIEDHCTNYTITNETGELSVKSYNVFPGIRIAYVEGEIENCIIENNDLDVIEINHCLKGRVEREVKGEFCYLGQGDMSINKQSDISKNSYFPLKHYKGISILIDVKNTPKCLSCFLEDVNVQPQAINDKFCNLDNCFVLRDNSSVEHIFSELYSVSNSIKTGYFKVKILELLLFLSDVEVDESLIKKFCTPKSQVCLAKAACKYLLDNKDKKITIDQLSERFHVSSTQLKNSFKVVYGMSIYSYIRTLKMHMAANMLKQTDYTVIDIASRFGYDNSSKFAKAFQDIVGSTPIEYRSKLD